MDFIIWKIFRILIKNKSFFTGFDLKDLIPAKNAGWPKCTDCTDFLFCNPKIVRNVRIFFQIVRIVRIFILEIHRVFF